MSDIVDCLQILSCCLFGASLCGKTESKTEKSTTVIHADHGEAVFEDSQGNRAGIRGKNLKITISDESGTSSKRSFNLKSPQIQLGGDQVKVIEYCESE